MSSILLYGGLLRVNRPPMPFKAVNIALRASPSWLGGVLYVNHTPYYRLNSCKDHFIEIKKKDAYLLSVNDRVIYRNDNQFIYNIDLKLNPASKYKNIPYADFFKYF